MATATVTLTVASWPAGQTHTVSPGWQLVKGTAAVQASPATYAAGGLPLTWVPLTGANGKHFYPSTGYSSLKPSMAIVQGIAGYIYEFDFANNKLLIRESAGSAAPLAEITDAAAIPAAVSGDTITFLAFFTEMG